MTRLIKVRSFHDDEPDAVTHILRVPEGSTHPQEVDEWPPHADVHDECGFVWSIHDTTAHPSRNLPGPFGCPKDELEAIARWGRS